MKRLWTPWRMQYIQAPKAKPRGCVFCSKVRASKKRDRDNLLLVRGERAFMVLNLYPYTNGHVMVLPYEHTGDLDALDGATLQEMMLLVGQAIRALRRTAHPHGFNIGVNMGRVAGAGIAEHVHIHVVPRWNGDTDFVGALAETRKIPELLPDTYDGLLKALQVQDPPAPVKRKSSTKRKQK